MEIKAVIFGCSGPKLLPEEFEFFRQVNPLGFILFARNIVSPEQIKQLTSDLRACVGRLDAPILIDQEGGRVQRMKAPHWKELPSADTYGRLFDEGKEEQAFLGLTHHVDTLVKTLLEVGVNADCWPCLDVASSDVSEVLGNRLFSSNPKTVITLSRRAIGEMLAKGLMPVVKHLPGYGRATVDPHKTLPIVNASLEELEQDFAPFKVINMPVWGMTAHVLYTALDDKPATISQKIIDFIRVKIGFEGFLITDDISMGALGDDIVSSSIQCLKAGCDCVLHCNGLLSDMKRLKDVIPNLTPHAIQRLILAKELL